MISDNTSQYRTIRNTTIPEYAATYAAIDNDRWKVIKWAAHAKRQDPLQADTALWFLVIEELRAIRGLLKELVDYEQGVEEDEAV